MMGRETSLGYRGQEGSILVAAMIILLVMSLMGIGLIQSSVKSSNTAASKTVDAEVFHITESCNQEARDWLLSQTRPPDSTNLPHIITRANLNHMLIGGETAAMLSKLSGYSYTCTVSTISNRAVTGDTAGEGSDIGMASGYGAAGDISPRYYYQVDARGSGPNNAAKRIITIVSMEF